MDFKTFVMKKKHIIKASFIVIAFLATVLPGCRKLIEVDLPIDKSTAEAVYDNKSSAVAAMTGVYAALINNSFGSYAAGADGMPVISSVLSDDLLASSWVFVDENRNEILFSGIMNDIWDHAYKKAIYPLNSLIEGMAASTRLPASVKKILTAEAKFMRGLSYLMLVNLYGDVPLVLSTDFNVNRNIPRSSTTLIYDQILSDLTQAHEDLSPDFLAADLLTVTPDRIRPTKAAAAALLARVYLYKGEWDKAEAMATEVINDPKFSLLTDLDEVFLANSQEAIFQLHSNNAGFEGKNTPDARFFLPMWGEPPMVISPMLKDVFEANDKRYTSWTKTITLGVVDFIVPYKYKAGADAPTHVENTMVFRLGEQYLIRAEARAWQDKITGAGSAAADVDAIRSRAGLTPTSATTKATMLEAIAKERRTELFCEGHRWPDLKRTGEIDNVMEVATPLKGGTWEPHKALLPIPYGEFRLNPALRGHQNPGYPEQL